MSVTFSSIVAHVEFRVSSDADGMFFGLHAPEAVTNTKRLFAGPVTEAMPDQLRALADRIEAAQNGVVSADLGCS